MSKKPPEQPDPARKSINWGALTPAELAAVLRAGGSRRATEETVRADIAAGGPTNPDGTINYLHWLAWMVKLTPP